MTGPMLVAQGLARRFGAVRAVRGVDFALASGATLGLVGESGSGKSTVARLALRLIEASAGSVMFDGRDLASLSREDLRCERRRMQMVFQDPYASLNPRMTVRETLIEPLIVHKIGRAAERASRVEALAREVGLPPNALQRYPHEFSGGQRQRVAIARALASEPELVVADEPVSALDVSIQAQILNLLIDLRERRRLTLLFISHDLRVVEFLCDEVAVMYLGEIVEKGPRRALYASPKHPYTQILFDSAPGRGKRGRLKGEVPSASAIPSGCAFRTRCPLAFARCAEERPVLKIVGEGHVAACHLLEAEAVKREPVAEASS
jgi:oligopeptide/dipeptide ABC transporter ATP-binding protein